jgi:5-methylcytosine-specific restriction enzyme subunit McrC
VRRLQLTEYQTVPGIELSIEERDSLRKAITIAPSEGLDRHFDLTPGSLVGAVRTESLAVEIRPKIPLSRVLFLISYALDPSDWLETGFDFGEEESVVEAIIPGFVRQVRRALRRGILQGYRTEEDALATVRGRIRFDDQIRNRFGIAPPVEVRYDEFTEDIDPNRIIKAAVRRLGQLRLRSRVARDSLRAFDGALAPVSLVEFDTHRLPEIAWTRLNSHYRPAVELAKLILRSTSFELRHGEVQSTSFLVDMNQVFEDFVVAALRDALDLPKSRFCQGATLYLDRSRHIRMRPDISWWEAGQCRFVGDVKYKRLEAGGIQHADVYQLVSYTIAADLPQGLLVYAAGEREPGVHEIVHVGKMLTIITMDLAGVPEDILQEVGRTAELIRAMRRGQAHRAA